MADIEATIRQMTNENTAKTFAFNSSEAEKERAWSREMSDTSHQREVVDLKRAGLNPVLSANGGASAYSASSASASADTSAPGLLAAIYQTKLNNTNAKKIADQNNKVSLAQKKTDLEIAKINAAASKYASDNAYAASRYATDHTKYGVVENFLDGLGFGSFSGSSSGSRATNAGRTVKKNVKSSVKAIKSGKPQVVHNQNIKARAGVGNKYKNVKVVQPKKTSLVTKINSLFKRK